MEEKANVNDIDFMYILGTVRPIFIHHENCRYVKKMLPLHERISVYSSFLKLFIYTCTV
jgi:hypothetical protein